MTNKFPTGSGKNTYSNCIFIEPKADDYIPTPDIMNYLSNDDFYNILSELIDFGISRNRRDYSNLYDNTDFVLYKKYTYEDACRLLNWEENINAQNIGGYKYDQKTKTYPVFINYDKAEDVSATINYEDRFVNNRTLIAISKSGRKLGSNDVRNFLDAEKNGTSVELFIRKNKDDNISQEFYYLGHMKPCGNAKEIIMNNTNKTAVEIEWMLDVPVREDIYQYIVNT